MGICECFLQELTRTARYFHIVPLVVECLRRKLVIDAAHELAEKEIESPSSSSASSPRSDREEESSTDDDHSDAHAPESPRKQSPTQLLPSRQPQSPSTRSIPPYKKATVNRERLAAAGDGSNAVALAPPTKPAPLVVILPGEVGEIGSKTPQLLAKVALLEDDDPLEDFSLSSSDPPPAAAVSVVDVPLSIMTMNVGQLQDLLSDDDLDIQVSGERKIPLKQVESKRDTILQQLIQFSLIKNWILNWILKNTEVIWFKKRDRSSFWNVFLKRALEKPSM